MRLPEMRTLGYVPTLSIVAELRKKTSFYAMR
jgi:hypothetical protein